MEKKGEWSHNWPPQEQTSPRLCSCIWWRAHTPQRCQGTPCWSTCRLDEPVSRSTVGKVSEFKRCDKTKKNKKSTPTINQSGSNVLSIKAATSTIFKYIYLHLSIYIRSQLYLNKNHSLHVFSFPVICASSPLPWRERSIGRAAACPEEPSQTASCIQNQSFGLPDALIRSPPTWTQMNTLKHHEQNTEWARNKMLTYSTCWWDEFEKNWFRLVSDLMKRTEWKTPGDDCAIQEVTILITFPFL